MQLARLDEKGRVLELFPKDGKESKKFEAEFLKTLVQVPDDVVVDEYFLRGVRPGKQPSSDYILVNNEWVIDPVIDEQNQKEAEYDAAMDRLQDISQIKDEATRGVLSDILILLRVAKNDNVKAKK